MFILKILFWLFSLKSNNFSSRNLMGLFSIFYLNFCLFEVQIVFYQNITTLFSKLIEFNLNNLSLLFFLKFNKYFLEMYQL